MTSLWSDRALHKPEWQKGQLGLLQSLILLVKLAGKRWLNNRKLFLALSNLLLPQPNINGKKYTLVLNIQEWGGSIFPTGIRVCTWSLLLRGFGCWGVCFCRFFFMPKKSALIFSTVQLSPRVNSASFPHKAKKQNWCGHNSRNLGLCLVRTPEREALHIPILHPLRIIWYSRLHCLSTPFLVLKGQTSLIPTHRPLHHTSWYWSGLHLKWKPVIGRGEHHLIHAQ